MSRQKISIDWFTILLYLTLVTVGWLAIYTASYDINNPGILDMGKNYGKQLFWIGTCLGVGALIQLFDTRFYTGFSYVIYGLVMLLLVLTLVVGSEISGSRSWIKLGFFNVQPAEFAKFGTCLVLARVLSIISLKETKNQLIVGGLIAFPMLLILLQGDAGSAIVFTSLILVLYREGLSGAWLLLGFIAIALFIASLLMPLNWVFGSLVLFTGLILLYNKGINAKAVQSFLVFLLPVIAIIVLAQFVTDTLLLAVLSGMVVLTALIATFTKRLVFFLLAFLFTCSIYTKGVDYVYNSVLKPHHKNRIGVILGIVEDNRGIGYNLNQSKIAIGSGGLWGKGFLQGTQNKGKFVPELSTDFIFCTIGEEFGFMGSLFVISLFMILFARIIHVAERQRSPFTRIYAYGVASILFFHFAVNLGMTIGIVPVIGIPLPFISYGGSSLLGFTILIFILVKLDSERFLYLR